MTAKTTIFSDISERNNDYSDPPPPTSEKGDGVGHVFHFGGP